MFLKEKEKTFKKTSGDPVDLGVEDLIPRTHNFKSSSKHIPNEASDEFHDRSWIRMYT